MGRWYNTTFMGLMVGGVVADTYIDKVLGYSPIAYWPLNEAAGVVATELVNGWDGATTGATVGQPGIGDGGTSYLFDGANDFVNIWSAGLSAAWDGDEFTMMAWVQMFNVGVWTDGILRNAMRIRADANNYSALVKDDDNNQLLWNSRVGANSNNITEAGHAEVTWLCMLATHSDSAGVGEHTAFLNGAQVGAPSVPTNVWVGALDNGTTLIGAESDVPVRLWNGYIAHCAIWDRPLTAPEIVDLFIIP